MAKLENETIEYKGEKITFWYFQVPMFHEDWHKAEDELGLVYLRYTHHGPDYWDDNMVFVKPEHKELAEDFYRNQIW